MKTSFSQQQRGGTLLGLIIGALIGLGGALAVAVYVTKVPVPFLNKIQLRSAETDAAEAKKTRTGIRTFRWRVKTQSSLHR